MKKRMNRLLAATIRALNSVLALLFIIGGAVAGSVYGKILGNEGGGIIIGIIGGFILAVVVCGFIALFIDMRSELIKIRLALTNNNKTTQ